jgi:hypothetical protein
MKTFTFWQRWLFMMSVVLVVMGLFIALLNQTALFALLFNRQIDPVFWGAAPLDPAVVTFQGWVYGVLGATVAGWGVSMAFIARYPFAARQPWAWQSIAWALGLWYVIDTAISATNGVYFNVAFNSLLLLAIALPLFFTRKAFFARQ